MTTYVIVVFGIVYLGMILGGLPYFQLDRTGIALLGAIALVGAGDVTPLQAAESLHLPTLILLFSFMVISAQMRLGGFYAWVTRRVAAAEVSPPVLLGLLMLVVAALSAVFSNDVVCLAVAPVLADACRRRRLDPLPFLLALACSANIGSALTLIGNPQNMLIGGKLGLSFSGYVTEAAVPVLAGFALTWVILVWQARGCWEPEATAVPAPQERRVAEALDPWQTAKGLTVAGALLLLFLFSSWPRDVAALVGAGLLLLSRRLHSSRMLGLVDWELLVLFIGLFVVNHAIQETGLTARMVAELAQAGVRLQEPAVLFGATFVLSNVVSNVPAVMLLLPVTTDPLAGPMLALVSTLAGNLLIVGSIANIIVVDAAARDGVIISWGRHARVGVPVTVATLAVTALWFGWRWH